MICAEQFFLFTDQRDLALLLVINAVWDRQSGISTQDDTRDGSEGEGKKVALHHGLDPFFLSFPTCCFLSIFQGFFDSPAATYRCGR